MAVEKPGVPLFAEEMRIAAITSPPVEALSASVEFLS